MRQRRIVEKGKRKNCAEEAGAIHDSDVDDIAALNKDTSGCCRKDIADVRNHGATSAKQLADQKKFELQRLKAKLANPWCGENFPPWLRRPANAASPDREKPDDEPLGGGVRV